MASVELSQVIDWTGGSLLHNGRSDWFGDVCTDTRSLEPGSLFIALRGANFDGHHFLDKAIDAGATGLVIDDRSVIEPLMSRLEKVSVVFVFDTLQALQDIAAGYRQSLAGRVIAITGSVGKTSTRQMVAACLEQDLEIHQTEGNLNNEIGLPQTLLKAKPSAQAIILEMGMRGPGEIALLSRIARPDIAVVTNIGLSHIGRLGSRDAILAAKTEIVQGLRENGLIILNGDDALLRDWGDQAADRYRIAYVTSSSDRAETLARNAVFVLAASQIKTTAAGSQFTAIVREHSGEQDSAPVSLPFPGAHHVHNALIGLAVSRELKLALKQAASGAAGMKIVGSRQRMIDLGGILMMDDSYNASPESMLAALDTLTELAGGRRRIAALGSMLELGDFADKAHYDLGRLAAQKGFSKLYLVGRHAESVRQGALSVSADIDAKIFNDSDLLKDALSPQVAAGDCILVKGSRAYAMERITEAIIRKISETEKHHAD